MSGANPAAPSGRETTIAALVEAATALFAEHGPDAVSLRQIAAHAGVNYGLIHQYVGSKDDLIRLVIRSVSENTARDIRDSTTPEDALRRVIGTERTPYVSMLAWTLLQGRDPNSLLGGSPALSSLLAQLGDDSEAARLHLVAATAMALGWQIFGDFLATGVGLPPDERDHTAAAVAALARSLLER